jgi:hypothetical protein
MLKFKPEDYCKNVKIKKKKKITKNYFTIRVGFSINGKIIISETNQITNRYP